MTGQIGIDVLGLCHAARGVAEHGDLGAELLDAELEFLDRLLGGEHRDHRSGRQAGKIASRIECYVRYSKTVMSSTRTGTCLFDVWVAKAKWTVRLLLGTVPKASPVLFGRGRQTVATKEAIWLQQLLSELTPSNESPYATIIYADNQGAIALAKDPKFHQRTKHIDLRYHFIREKVENGDIQLEYMHTSRQMADGFTKALPKDAFYRFRDAVGLESS